MHFLKGLAAVAAMAVVERDIEFDGVTEKFHFKRISGHDADAIALDIALDDDGKPTRTSVLHSVAAQVAASLCDESGKPVATAAEIDALPAGMRQRFVEVMNEVNGFTRKKSSTGESGSGTPSPSDSEALSST
jgi:hypothetical protein